MSKKRKLSHRKPTGRAHRPATAKPTAPRVNTSTTSPIPFKPTDRVLLLGEGDFSFSTSLVRHHGIHHLTATSYDSEAGVVEKYPQARENVGFLRGRGVVVAHGVDAGGAHKVKVVRRRRGEMAPKIPSDGDDGGEERQGKAGGGDACGFNVIGFMFPHVGGKSTDMDRQIRANQQLLLSFFNSSKQLLAPRGTVVTTLFEGKHYDLWDVKGLAKSAGLRTRRSFRFSADSYPEYSHARTLGNIRGGGGWKGQERSARTYIFELDDRSDEGGRTNTKKRKRTATDDSGSDEAPLD